MAITATAQSALQDLSWDETIVPTLRTRLESESRAISKRMSTVSIGSGEDGTLQYNQKAATRPQTSGVRTEGRVTPSSMTSERPSAIPRPSLNYPRPLGRSSNEAGPQAASKGDSRKPGQQQRSRTISQPYVFDAALVSTTNGSNGYSNQSTTRTTNALPTPASSRSSSPSFPSPPNAENRENRHNKASGNKRTDSPVRTTPTYSRPMQQEYGDPREWDADEDTYDASYSSINVDIPHNVKQIGILHEAPPFSANSSFASEVEVRPSLEERPFEHWYRGDLARNGGVGELRVGNRMEMLEIASYGHKLRSVRNDAFLRQRRRAESIGHRESIVFDEEGHDSAPLVLDESPLTDMEADVDLETDRELGLTRARPEPREQLNQVNRGPTEPLKLAVPPSTPNRRQPSHIPRATPTAVRTTQRTASEPLSSLSASTSSIPHSRSRSPANTNTGRMPNSQSQVISTPAQKRGRAKSPAVTPAGKKLRPSAAQAKRSKSTADVRPRQEEVAEYPEVPDGVESMADAIPSWTQPKKAGNWDDVVLPVVARKMGLDDQYEEADGSPKAQFPDEVVPPQPGTFGYDPNKYRRRYDPATGEEISMDELETTPTKTVNDEIRNSKRFSNMPGPQTLDADGYKQQSVNRYVSPPSPAPFAQYSTPNGLNNVAEPEVAMEDDNHGSCCSKCIIM